MSFLYEISLVILIDEWDCLFREYKQDKEAQKELLRLRERCWSLLWNKDEKAVAEGTDKATKKHTCVIEEVYKNS
mgnify:CR=1 FL=1